MSTIPLTLDEINELAEARVSLYTQLNQNAVYLNDRYGDTRNSAVNQKAVVDIVEAELDSDTDGKVDEKKS